MRKKLTLFGVLVLIAAFVHAQSKQLTGKITDTTGSAVGGASVNIKGVRKGTSALADGTFKINVPKNAVIVISAVGFEQQEIDVSNTDNISVQLHAGSSRVLSEIVVTALGIKREKKELAVATQTINADEINKSGTGNPLSELNGKASGLTVINSSGDPGGGTYIRLRGVTSITGNNQPLMVVDGVPIDNSINNYDPTSAQPLVSGASGNLTGGSQPTNRGVDLNPSDIESITLLKGPAATALYGIQAASGAIIVTTKKGGQGKKGSGISFNSSVTFDKVSNLPPLQNKFSQGDGGQYLDPTTGTRTSWGAAIDTLFWDGSTSYPFDKHGNIVGKSDPSAKIPVKAYNPYNFFQTGLTFNNNIALSGGGDKSGYRLSLGNLHQTGIVPKTKYDKTTFSLSGQSNISNKLSVSGGANYIHSNNDKVQQGSNLSGIMLGLVRTPPTFDNANGLSDPANDPASYVFPSGAQRNYRGGGGYDNPYWTVNRNPFHSDVDRVFGFGQASLQLQNWISLSYRVGGDVYAQDDKNSYDIGSRAFPAGAIYLNEYFSQQFNSDFIINMKKTFSKDFTGSLLLGQNYFTSSTKNRFSSATGLVLPDFLDFSNGSSFIATETELRKRTSAFYGEAHIDFKNMLFLTITARDETSSTLPAKNNTFFYPSVSLGWMFSELMGLNNNSALSLGKLRASFAQVGKDAPIYGLNTPYATAIIRDGFTTGIQFPVNGNAGYQISSATSVIGNPDLKPENTYSYEGGIDLDFFKSRISFNGTVYYSRSGNVILTASIPYTSGFAAELLNAATIDNKGLELTLNTTPIKAQNGLRWDLNFNWSRNINKVVALAPGLDRLLISGFGGGEAEIDAVAGQPFGVIYGNTYARATASAQKDFNKGQLLIDDNKADGDGYGQAIVGGPNAIIGNSNPKWFGSVISNLSYAGFSFGLQVDIRHGGDVWNGTRGAMAYFGTAGETGNRGTPTVFKGLLGHLDGGGNVVHYAADGVTEVPGAGATNNVQSAYNQNYWQFVGNSFQGPQEIDVEDGSFVRIRQISLTYDLPKRLLSKSAFTNVSLTIFANNPKLWTKYDGVDPETSLSGPANGQGLDYFNNPGTKSFGLRLNIGL
jgi:TonB-linked SusC/RagA family outer membrane protein